MPLTRLLSLLVPPLCVSCGDAAPLHQPLCRECLGGLRWLSFEQPLAGSGVAVWAAVSYEGAARARGRAGAAARAAGRRRRYHGLHAGGLRGGPGGGRGAGGGGGGVCADAGAVRRTAARRSPSTYSTHAVVKVARGPTGRSRSMLS